MLAVVVPAASASRVKRPNLLNDASHKPVGFYLFFFKMSNAVSTTDAGLYVVPDGGLPSLIPNEGPQEPWPPACGDA
jgi:hypothetical protein